MSLSPYDPEKVEEEARSRILIIDDEIGARMSLWIALKDIYDVLQASSAEKGLALLEHSQPFDVVLVDYRMPDQNGLDFLKDLRRRDPNISVAMISAHASLESATGAMRLEAFDYIEKPFEESHLREVVARGVRRTLERRSSAARIDLEHTAAALIHDLANPLTTVAFAAHQVAKRYGPDSAEALVESAARCQQLIDIWNNRHAVKKELVWYSIDNLMDGLQKQVNQQNSPVRIRFSPPPKQVQVLADRVQFLRVLDNLFRNAVYAVLHSEAGLAGGIVVTLRFKQPALVIEVKDTGCGMSEATLEKLFSPYFTTKGTKGTGLGLAICKQLMTEMEGEISVQSQEGKGTTVELVLKARKAEEGDR